MKKELTERSFEALKTQFRVLSKDQQRAIVGGGYFDDYGIGYFDSQGNYHWSRTREDTSQTGLTFKDFWDSTNSSAPSGSGMYDHNIIDGYGTKNKPISIDDYNTLAKMDRWHGGYVEFLGYVNVYASSVQYGNSIYTGNSWYAYGSNVHPVSEPDFYQLVKDGKWHGGCVASLGYQPSNPTLPGSSNSHSVNPINKSGVNISTNREYYGNDSTMSKFLATAYDENGFVIATLEGVFLEPGTYYEESKVAGSDTSIAAGTYEVIPSTYNGDPGYYEVSGVEGRSQIKIHRGVDGKNTTGCFLPGETGSLNHSTGEYEVSESTKKLKELNKFLDNYGKDGITISVSL